MPFETKFGGEYRRKLPHFRRADAIYHVRFSTHPTFGNLREEWMFEVVEYSILFAHKKTNLVYAYVIMPNHVHLALQPLPRSREWNAFCDYRQFHRLEAITRVLKSYTANAINKKLGRSGHLWLEEPFDRIVRDQKDLDGLIDYIHRNPVRWQLVDRPEQYRWSSLATFYSGKEMYSGWFDLDFPRLDPGH